MSCTVLAVPILLVRVVAALSDLTLEQIEAERSNNRNNNSSYNENYDCDDVHMITADHFIERTFETAFADKNTLIKTLEEHGVLNIKTGDYEDETRITGQIDTFTLTFYKPSEDKPYVLKINCLDTDNAQAKVSDLSNEYALNVQEETYLSIIEKLKDNNMEVEDEEVLDDNTIVLTVNID